MCEICFNYINEIFKEFRNYFLDRLIIISWSTDPEDFMYSWIKEPSTVIDMTI